MTNDDIIVGTSGPSQSVGDGTAASSKTALDLAFAKMLSCESWLHAEAAWRQSFPEQMKYKTDNEIRQAIIRAASDYQRLDVLAYLLVSPFFFRQLPFELELRDNYNTYMSMEHVKALQSKIKNESQLTEDKQQSKLSRILAARACQPTGIMNSLAIPTMMGDNDKHPEDLIKKYIYIIRETTIASESALLSTFSQLADDKREELRQHLRYWLQYKISGNFKYLVHHQLAVIQQNTDPEAVAGAKQVLATLNQEIKALLQPVNLEDKMSLLITLLNNETYIEKVSGPSANLNDKHLPYLLESIAGFLEDVNINELFALAVKRYRSEVIIYLLTHFEIDYSHIDSYGVPLSTSIEVCRLSNFFEGCKLLAQPLNNLSTKDLAKLWKTEVLASQTPLTPSQQSVFDAVPQEGHTQASTSYAEGSSQAMVAASP